MKKNIYLIIAFFTTVTYSQTVIFGTKAGVNYTGFHTSNGTETNLFGFNVGGIAKIDLNKSFGLQTELNLNTKGGNYNIPMALKIPQIKLTYLNIPILAKLHITKKFNFETGPEIGFLVGKKAEYSGQNIPIGDVKSFDVSINAGLSYEFEKGIFIQTRYGYGLSKLFEDSDYKNSCISLSLGYFFK